MYPGFFDVFHDPHDHTISAIGNGVDVHLGGIFEEAIDQYGLSIGYDKRFGNVTLEL